MTNRIVSIGADPEFFLEDKRRGCIISAFGKIGGTKGNPISLNETSGILEDGDAMELNITPCFGRNELRGRIRSTLEAADEFLSAKGLTRNRALLTEANVEFPDDPEYKPTFGCAPDQDAYTAGIERPCPMSWAMEAYGENIRFIGGHIHFGFSKPVNIPTFIQARLADVLVGHYLLRTEEYYGTARRVVYGLPGLFREKPYGFEYRTPSNVWWDRKYTSKAVDRIFAFAELLADSDNQMQDIVRFYNTMDWDNFKENFATPGIGEVLPELVKFGPHSFILRAWC